MNNGYLINNRKSECCGCSACVSICNRDAIHIQMDENGFYFPFINDEKCISCGLCTATCTFENRILNSTQNQKIYAAQNINESILRQSSSGGVFFEIAKHVLSEGGVVYGATYDKNFKVHTIEVDCLDNLPKLMGSKYVQSYIDSYRQIMNSLRKGKKVLFSGTPCQVDGCLSYLKQKHIDIGNLLTIDLICHGVPSAGIYMNYLNILKKIFQSKLSSYSFRDKGSGKVQAIKAVFANGAVYRAGTSQDIYYRLFSYDYILRECCYKCPYTNFNRVADITLGDFWGYKGRLDIKKGISLVLVNTNVGSRIWKEIEKHFSVEECSKDTCLQGPLMHPARKPNGRGLVMFLLKRRLWKPVNALMWVKRIYYHFIGSR